MRLNQIKLAGFKSFVDPTHLSVPGELVGVVGPNGCGKSNIIDAVRWVLGESRASALRGDSMQDVIFNGSTLRKPVARASVELTFDNSLGRAAGQWSQYAEISVKRVLTRDGESSYLINNTQVRRKDIHDIFLGTGLGPRAYAIIEQGMISRIIEAKPEELRVFLEEAAGVSKYKERRRETENRLSDTRENLSRVGDIRQELGAQIEKLERQAEVAKRFNALSSERQYKQNLLWVLRLREAEAEGARYSSEIQRNTNEVEAETARLRESESLLERAREEHYAAGDALAAAQGELYEANAEVSRLESEIRHIAETRQRLDAQAAQFASQHATGERQLSELKEANQLWSVRIEDARISVTETQRRLAELRALLPELESQFRTTRTNVDALRDQFAGGDQSLALEQTHLAHAERTIHGLTIRAERLSSEKLALGGPDELALEDLEARIGRSNEEASAKASELQRLEVQRADEQQRYESARQRLQVLEREMSLLDGRLLALQKIQSHVDESEQSHDWITGHSLDQQPRLWQTLRAAEGWESAVESALRERLHALQFDDPLRLQALLETPPSAKLTIFVPGHPESAEGIPGLKRLSDLITVLDQGVKPVLDAWLKPYYAIEGIPDMDTRLSLPNDLVLVNREGHQFSRHGIAFHASQSADSGMLARQREIEELMEEARAGQLEVASAGQYVQQCERTRDDCSSELEVHRGASVTLKQEQHDQQVQLLKLNQARESYFARLGKIEQEQAEIQSLTNAEEENRQHAAAAIAQVKDAQDSLARSLQEARAAHEQAAHGLESHRTSTSSAERDAQAAGFAEKECANKLDEIDRATQTLLEQNRLALEQQERVATELAALDDFGLKESLQSSLEIRVEKEEALATARVRQDDASSSLRTCDEARLESDRKLGPLRDGLADLRLKEQAAKLNVAQFSDALAQAGLAEDGIAALAEELREGQRPAPLQGEITKLSNAIAELGAINMAALDELSVSVERKTFLDAQADDLSAALETLENAIRRIDRETRDLMQTTFDAVNEQFAKLFPMLFGGGEAKLVMTGEEILDAGVQVVARPPGKKNSTIHLLSGGEKAMTAIALVFSFFQLNPAPFCLLDEVDAPLDDANTSRFCELVRKMSLQTQFLYISHNKLTMEMATHLIGVTMQEQGVSRVVAVDIDEALQLREPVAA